MGAKDFTQSLLNEKRLLTDTTMRDAQQSLMATRMRTKDLIGALMRQTHLWRMHSL